MLISGLIVNKIKTEKLKKIFAVVILLAGCWIIVKELVLEDKLPNKTMIGIKDDDLILPGFSFIL
jgi:hypothetical protein